ncbi:MAG TPA: c-type cytochrome [Steroidobacteraceae bacterium]|nr:c-type cytochrome [Steroidobacteraceae bacterium]
MSKPPALTGLAAAVSLLLFLTGCRGGRYTPPVDTVPGGNPRVGAHLIESYRCGACHMIPGIKGADGLVGPPLILFARRTYVGGELPNTPPNLIRWIEDPSAVEPGTAMPALGLNPQQARDVAAYLYTLR